MDGNTQNQDGAMIAFFLPGDVANQLSSAAAVLGDQAMPPEQMHVTLQYLGDAINIDRWQRDGLIQALQRFAMNTSPLRADINGVGRFVNNDPNAIYANVDAPLLDEFCDALCWECAGYMLNPNPNNHGVTPHITLGYIPADTDMPNITLEPIPVIFHSISLAVGTERYTFELGAPGVSEYAEKSAPTDAAQSDWAYTPDKDQRDTWRLDVSTDANIEKAIVAINNAGFQAKRVAIPKGELPTTVGNIKAAIESKITDEGKRKYLLSRLDAVTVKDEPAPSAKAIKTISNVDVEPISCAIKALDDDGWRIGGYLVLYGDPSRPDLQGDWFTKSTDFALDLFPDRRPMLYHHGLNAKTKATAVGYIDSIEPDDIGLWAEGELNKRNKYAKTIKDLVAKGALAWSSGSLPHLVKHRNDAKSGEIVAWPIVEGSPTPTPAEFRGTDITPVIKTLWEPNAIGVAYKALNLSIADTILGQDDEQDSAQESATPVNALKMTGPGKLVITQTQKPKPESRSMKMSDLVVTKEELERMIADGVKADREREQAAVAAQKAIDAKIEEEVQRRLAALGAGTSGGSAAPAGKALPMPQGDKAKTNITEVKSLKYNDLSAEDMSYMVSIYQGYARAAVKRGADDRTPLEQSAIRFISEMRNDTDKKVEREISAKALREVATKALPEKVIDALPYKSMDDVFANDYDKTAQQNAMREIAEAVKANELDNTAQTSFGLEWIPTIWNGQLWMRVRISNPYASSLETIQMTAATMKLPIESTDPTVYYIAEATDQTQLVYGSGNTMPLGKVGTSAPSIAAKKQGIRVAWSDELLEDSVLIPIIANYRRQSERSLKNAIDDTIVNGDVATGANVNVNLIDGTPTTGSSYLALDGFRKYALVTNTAQGVNFGGAPTMALMRSMRQKLAKQYAVDLPNLVYVMGFEAYMTALNMPEFSTWQQLGVQGANVTGLLPGGSPDTVSETPRPVGYVDGVPVYVSAQIALTNSSGMTSGTGSNNLYSFVTLHHRTRWMLGYRRNVMVDVAQFAPLSDTYQLWATVRYGLVSFDTQAAVVGYNVVVS